MKNEHEIKLVCATCKKELSKKDRKAKKLDGLIYCKKCSGLIGQINFILIFNSGSPLILCSHCNKKLITIKPYLFDEKESKYYHFNCITYEPENNMVIL
jgi:DNA-directed RNA polymerase subunit RPC12/RpoP